jgi:hypothetical protein
MTLYQTETLIHDIQDLKRAINTLTRDVSLKPTSALDHQMSEELRVLLRIGHELRGFIAGIDRADRETIAGLNTKRGLFATNESHYRKALKSARAVHKDDVEITRELAVCLTATQQMLHEQDVMALWEGIRHILHELKHLESLLLRLKEHLSGMER